MLDKATLKNTLENIFSAEGGNSASDAADAIANAIDTFVRGAQVTALPGEIMVQGSPSAQANTAPLTITGGLS